MKSWLIAVVAVVSSTAFAQEIGTEIAPSTPDSGVETDTSSPRQSRRERREQRRDDAGEEAHLVVKRVSASAGSFGLRAGFSAGNFSAPSATNLTNFGSSIGAARFITDGLKVLIDLGFSLGVSGNNVGYAVNALIGFDYLFRTPADALRPFIHAGVLSRIDGSNGSGPNISYVVQIGGGAEYFFSPNFSLNARLLIAVLFAVPNGEFTLGITTLSPGVGGTWYF